MCFLCESICRCSSPPHSCISPAQLQEIADLHHLGGMSRPRPQSYSRDSCPVRMHEPYQKQQGMGIVYDEEELSQHIQYSCNSGHLILHLHRQPDDNKTWHPRLGCIELCRAQHMTYEEHTALDDPRICSGAGCSQCRRGKVDHLAGVHELEGDHSVHHPSPLW